MTTKFPPGAPNWVELGSTDVTGAAAFYRSLFGWSVEDLGPDSGGYGIIRKDGKQVGGIGPATDPNRGTSWSVYFATDNADQTATKVEANGGTVVVAPTAVMDQGRMAAFRDPTEAYFSVWEPGRNEGAELVDAPGALSWAELMTTDIAAAKSFYRAVLGTATRDVDMAPGMTYTVLQVGDENVAGAMPIGTEHGPTPSHWSPYFDVEDCDATADKAVQLGGAQMLRDDTPAGRLAFLADPQGAEFCIIKPNPEFSI